MYVFMYVYVYTHLHAGAYRGPKRALGPLKLQTVACCPI